MRRGAWWKLVGLAAVVGVAATGVALARAERRRRTYSPDEVRRRLHERYARITAESAAEAAGRSGGETAPDGH
ncbi:MAG: hypothetical protein ACFCVF_08320 [Kineosporiaceae bacterium]